MRHFEENESTIIYTVTDSGDKLEVILRETLNISGRFLFKLSKSDSIFVNGLPTSLKKKVTKGDQIIIKMEDETEPNEPEDIPVEIVYEDFDIIILNKQPGIVVHPTKSHSSGTIANGLAKYFKDQGIRKKIRFVNRLDMDTSGILVVAKNSYGHHQLSLQFEDDTVEKKYLALVQGVVKDDFGIIDQPIGKDESDPIRQQVLPDGKESLTKFKVVQRYKETTLVEVELLTGRNHQIRVHMKYLGHPLIGDSLYHEPSSLIDRQALHSSSLSFYKARTGEHIEVKAPLPDDMVRAIEKLSTIE